MKSASELWELLREAYAMPHGAAQIALYDQVLRHVDGAGDAELAFTTRMLATTGYTYGGEPAKGFVTFAWCLSEFDSRPAAYHARMRHSLLWNFKTMVNGLLKFPEVPLDRTYAVLDDMERRHREGGHSMQAVAKKRYEIARHVGDTAAADDWYERWVTAPRDDLSDCVGCDPTTKVRHLAERGRDVDAVALAGPVLAGKLTCTEQPQTMLTELMVPYLRTGRHAEAADAHRRAYRRHRELLADLADIGEHLAFCARTGNEHRGLELLQRHVDWLATAPSPDAEMSFAADAAVLLGRLVERGHGDAVVRLRDSGEVAAGVLGPELAQRAAAIARRFDARNGTDAQSRRIAERLATGPYGVVLPLSPTARPVVAAPVPPAASAPRVPADADAATLLALAREHELADRDAELAATLAAFERRFPEPDALGPELVARYETLAGGRSWETDHAVTAARWERATALFTAAGLAGEASSVRGRLGMVHCLDGRVGQGRAMVEQDLAHQRAHGDARLRAGAWSRMAHVHLLTGELDEANAAQDRADEAVTELGDPRTAALYALRRAQNRAAADRLDEARTAAAQACEFYRAYGPPQRLAMAATLVGRLAPGAAEALAAYDEVLGTGEAQTALQARHGRGRALLGLDRAAEAVPELVEAVALSAERGLAEAGAYGRLDLAHAYRSTDRVVEAAEVAEEALAAFERLGHDDPANDTRLLLADLHRALGDSAAAAAMYRDLVGRLDDNLPGRAQIRELLGQVLFDADSDAQAAEEFRLAIDDLRGVGDPAGELRLLRRRLAALHYADDQPAAEELIRQAARPQLTAEPAVVWGSAMLRHDAARFLLARGRFAEALPYLADGPAALRGVGATEDADLVEGTYAEALFRSGASAHAAMVLAGLHARLGPDAPSRDAVAALYADVLDALGSAAEAAELRTREGLNDR